MSDPFESKGGRLFVLSLALIMGGSGGAIVGREYLAPDPRTNGYLASEIVNQKLGQAEMRGEIRSLERISASIASQVEIMRGELNLLGRRVDRLEDRP